MTAEPLSKPHAPIDQADFVGRGDEKEFLFDIVHNRHNGLDVDKVRVDVEFFV